MLINRRLFLALAGQCCPASDDRTPMRFVAAFGPDILTATDGRRLVCVHPKDLKYSDMYKVLQTVTPVILDTSWAKYAMSEPDMSLGTPFDVQRLLDGPAAKRHTDMLYPEVHPVMPDASKLKISVHPGDDFGFESLERPSEGPAMSVASADRIVHMARGLKCHGDSALRYLKMSPRGINVLRLSGESLDATYAYMPTRM